MCKTGKVRHPSREGAMIALKRIKNAGLKAYRCPFCKGWHLANDNRDWKVQARIDQLLGR
jgi:hypothetical protein